MVDFIYEKHNVLNLEQCTKFIKVFEEYNNYNVDGSVGKGVDTSIKDSTDFYFTPFNRELVKKLYGQSVQDMLDEVLVNVYRYMDKYPVFKDSDISFDPFNLQRYTPGQGFHAWHYEKFEDTIRLFVWMIYLNDVPDGGTQFMMQERIVKAEQGKLVIFPADWTYTHRGEISNTTTKYILTGWVSLLNSNNKE